MKHKTGIFILIRILILTGLLQAQKPVIGIDEKPGHGVPGDIQLLTADSALVSLQDYMGIPLVLTLVYYNCPGVCTPLLNGIAELVERADPECGKDYEILTVSFDHRETPRLASEKKEAYAKLLGRAESIPGWHFFTSDSARIARLSRAVGFGFYRNGDDLFHVGALIILSPSGKVVRYLYGAEFNHAEFRMAIADALEENYQPSISKKPRYCYNYEPVVRNRSGSIFLIFGGLLVVITILIFIIFPPRGKFR